MPSGKDLVAGAGAGFGSTGAVRLTLVVAGRCRCFGLAFGAVGDVTVTGGSVLESGAALGSPDAFGSVGALGSAGASGAALGGWAVGGEFDVSVDALPGVS